MQYRMYINGEWIYSKSGKNYSVINPGNEEELGKVPLGGAEDAKSAIDAARTSFDKGVWSDKTPAERSNFLLKLADMVERNAEKLAQLESANQGKTIKYAKNSDLPSIVDNLRFFAGAARMLEGKAAANYTGSGISMLKREPVGVVASIVPWNYPLSIAVWKIAPALAAGNSVVIKPASLTPLTLLELAKLIEHLELPAGVLNVVTGPGETVGAELAKNSKVDMISVTGDTETGKTVMQLASSNVKKVHLELGGKAPLIVFEDADMEMAVQSAVAGGFFNNGQDCTAASRIFVHDKIYFTFIKKLAEATAALKVGDQLNVKTDVGPMVSAQHLQRVMNYIMTGKDQGARLMHGGKKLIEGGFERGFWVEPTIFIDAKQDMGICQEEIFGPVLSVIKFDKVDEVIAHANNVKYGLAASVFTKDLSKAIKTASQLNFGTVWINEHGTFASEMPHGGFKQSGFGKDLSLYAIDEYTRIKHIYFDTTDKARKPWHSAVFGKKP